MVTKALILAGAGATALLGVWAVQETLEPQDEAETAPVEAADRGPYRRQYKSAPRAERVSREAAADAAASGGANAGAGDETGETGKTTEARADSASALRDAHERLTASGQPEEADWLQASLDGEPAPHPVWHLTILPGDTVEIEAEGGFALSLNGDVVTQSAQTHSWTAPRETGNHVMRVFNTDGESQLLTVFVVEPYDGETVLEGYRIGSYPETPPDGFIRLTEADMELPVSPSFEIGQFICKQQIGHWPKFILTSGDMLERLELLLENLREDGRTDADTFFIMSGFRTPFYNTAIGSARLSRHMYGDASDIYPDVEGNDSVMDDLNDDGRITREDAEWLYDYAARLYSDSDEVVAGGIGAYGANAVHGPFVHIDGRGRAARWGRHGS